MDHVNVTAKFEVRSFTCSWDNSGYLETFGSPWIRRSRSSKVVDFGTNRKRVCDFLLVRHGKLGAILQRFGDIAGFCAPVWPHPYSTLIEGVPVAPDRPCWGQREPWNYFRSIPTCVKIITQHHRQTDRETTYCGITALCVASRGKEIATQSTVG